jgi:hypothetical protein
LEPAQVQAALARLGDDAGTVIGLLVGSEPVTIEVRIAATGAGDRHSPRPAHRDRQHLHRPRQPDDDLPDAQVGRFGNN